MTVSDLLTLIGILLAVFAFISERNREYVFLKFSKVHLGLLIFAFIFIHYLLSYEWWRDKIAFVSIFELDGFPLSSAWAYIISVITLFLAIYKIFVGNFPLSNRKKVLKYYEKLLLRNDVAFLAEQIENYHLENIVTFLRKKKAIKIPKETGITYIDENAYSDEYKKVINSAPLIYGSHVYYSIIQNDAFIDSVSTINPYLFATIIGELDSKELQDDEFVNRYLKNLISNKNGNFFREIRNNQNLANYDAYRISIERPILYALFNDIKVVATNQAWRSIGEYAILEIQEESKKDFSLLRESNKEQENDTVWTYRMTNAIWYFDIMVRQAIVQKLNDNMWMFYYAHFVNVLLSNMRPLASPDSDLNNYTRNYNLIESIFTKMMDWKSVCIKSKEFQLISSIYQCIGLCIYELVQSDKLNENNKNALINWVWEDLIKTIPDNPDQADAIQEIIDIGFEMFKRPSNLFSTDASAEVKDAYLKALRKLWDERDIPILTGIHCTRANLFETEVIDQLLNEI